MKKYLVCPFLILGFLQSFGQTFEDCSNDYHRQFNKIQLQRTLKELNNKTADSLVTFIDAALDSCIIGKEPPDFSLVGLSNKLYTKKTLEGKVVLLNFWYLGCGPCVMEIPVLNRLHLSYKDNEDFVFLSILMDKEEEFKKFLEKGLTKRSILFDVVPDSKTIVKDSFKLVKVFPTNLFIDRDGKIFRKTMGGIIDSDDEAELETQYKSIIDKELYKYD